MLLCCSLLFLCWKKDNRKTLFNYKTFEKTLRCIPKGKFEFDDSAETSGYKIKSRMIKVDSFYMCDHVVSNEEYRIFLTELKNTDKSLYRRMFPDTLVWRRNNMGFMEDMVKYYLRHPAYGNYPVVGVSHEQAEYYCKWLTECYKKEPRRKFKNAVFKLPTLYQWEKAALGGLEVSPFPWGSPYLVNSSRKFRGQRMANYLFIPEQSIKRISDSNAHGKLTISYIGWMNGFTENEFDAEITSPVKSYWPNGYGLYNMAGDVAEYVSEVGISKGGSWCDPAFYLQIWAEQYYSNAQSVSNKIGFRVAMEVGK